MHTRPLPWLVLPSWAQHVTRTGKLPDAEQLAHHRKDDGHIVPNPINEPKERGASHCKAILGEKEHAAQDEILPEKNMQLLQILQ